MLRPLLYACVVAAGLIIAGAAFDQLAYRAVRRMFPSPMPTITTLYLFPIRVALTVAASLMAGLALVRLWTQWRVWRLLVLTATLVRVLSLAGEAAKMLELRREIGHNIYIPHYWAFTCAQHLARALLDILIPALVVSVGAMPSLRAHEYL